ncbi:MAG: hypothetical protein NTU44_17375 [Bacteroidetes bacterium]|nr:hypothetical protein [Bacteroidota bacterium]
MASSWSGKILYRIVTVLTSPVFLAIILTLAVFSFSPKYSKYSLTKVNSGISDKPDCLEYCFDFNNDGKYEKIVLFNSKHDKAAVKILDREEVSIQVKWNFIS